MPKVNPLASYVEKYILNPGARIGPNLDEENEETAAVISKRIEGEESAKAVLPSISKLRLQNAEALSDRDPRYSGKKVSRKDIEATDTASCDPELAKLCFLEEDSDLENVEFDDKDGYSSNSEINVGKPSQSFHEETKWKSSKKKLEADKHYKYEEHVDDDYMRLGEDITEQQLDKEEEEEEDNDGDDNDEEDNDEDDKVEEFSDEKGYSEIEEEEEQQFPNALKTFSTENTDHIAKGLAVKNQCSIFDRLFETRIGLQKVSSIANQLPQHNVFEEFLKNKNYPQYKVNHVTARKAIKKLIKEILDLQESLLLNNTETESVLTNDYINNEHKSNEIRNAAEDSSQTEEKRGTKRKIEEFGQILSKRHKAIIPFRDETLTKWYEKAKLLANQTRGNFSSFEISPVHQIRNILANKDQLIKRTQLLGISRGNVYKILGKPDKEQNSSLSEEHDPEIFDDSDFYLRMLEDVLKSKTSVSEDLTEVSRKWIDIQKLRKKAKKNVDTRASKGRKIRFEVMSKLQQFIAPCKPSQMNDDATNKLFSSLFGQSLKTY